MASLLDEPYNQLNPSTKEKAEIAIGGQYGTSINVAPNESDDLNDISSQSLQNTEIYLTFNHRPQRLIVYNLMIFIWSLSSMIYYSNIVSDNNNNHNLYSSSTNNELLTFYLLMTLISSWIILIESFQVKYYEFKSVNFQLNISGTAIELNVYDAIKIVLGFLYFVAFLMHSIITIKSTANICKSPNNDHYCRTTMASASLFSILIPLLLAADLTDNFLRNPYKRILIFCLIILLSVIMYGSCLDHYNFGKNELYLPSYLVWSKTCLWLMTGATSLIYICEGFYHEGILKKYFQVVVSFALLCSPMIAFGANIIVFESNKLVYHESWFLIVVFSALIAYDLHTLDRYNQSIIGAQTTFADKLVSEPPNILATPNVASHKQQQSINDMNSQSSRDDEDPLSLCLFVTYSFNLNNKKQRMIIYNVILLLYSIGKLVFYFNFLSNFGNKHMHYLSDGNGAKIYAWNLSKNDYAMYVISSLLMVVVSTLVICIEWFDIYDKMSMNVHIYRYMFCLLYLVCGTVQLVTVLSATDHFCSDYKHVNGDDVDTNVSEYDCVLEYIGGQFLSFALPLVVLGVDMSGVFDKLFNNLRIRVIINHLLLSLTALLFYTGYFNFHDDGNMGSYTKARLSGFVMIAYSFIFGAIISQLFVYFKSKVFANMSNAIASLLIIVGLGFVVPMQNLEINISQYALFVPFGCLVAYEIQLIRIEPAE